MPGKAGLSCDSWSLFFRPFALFMVGSKRLALWPQVVALSVLPAPRGNASCNEIAQDAK
ncbi:MAG: hypothetical protein IPJ48_04680 [Propionivibrio sp.]|uniref:Uncharacterized protein n=1 Tax=Candidatus Propionivibrio dominans TaxID=2954373 RepID=A0A9D7IC06_9RHOO|nr:hypothetical protein [Candidatus Propionivibrio dominans]